MEKRIFLPRRTCACSCTCSRAPACVHTRTHTDTYTHNMHARTHSHTHTTKNQKQPNGLKKKGNCLKPSTSGATAEKQTNKQTNKTPPKHTHHDLGSRNSGFKLSFSCNLASTPPPPYSRFKKVGSVL